MSFAYILFFENAPGIDLTVDAGELARLRDLVRTTPGLTSGVIFTPEVAEDLFNHDGASPPLGLQLHFNDLPSLEAAVAAGSGHLQAVTGILESLKGARTSQQVMLVRPFPVDDSAVKTAQGALPCSYVVHYPGPAADLNLWLTHYIASHPPIMRKFPGIRSIEILSRVDWCGGLDGVERVAHIQRNRILFDSAGALQAALQSPVRHEMRADFHTFPAYEGGNFHYPMATETVTPSA